jgi:flagella basal body P-ring formation protein FlgA
MKHILRITAIAALLMVAFSLWPMTEAFSSGSVVLNEEVIRRVVTEYLAEKTRLPGVEVNLKKMSFNGKIPLPAGKVSYEILSPQEWEGWGRAPLALIVRVDGRVVQNIPVNVEIEALADVVVAVRGMERGMVVEKGDVALQKRDLATLPKKTCRDIQEVVGKRVRVGMRGNSPVRSDYLERLPLVKNGDKVSIIAENDMFRITTIGIVKGNGAEGDTVLVRRESAQKEIPALVVDANTVRVEF